MELAVQEHGHTAATIAKHDSGIAAEDWLDVMLDLMGPEGQARFRRDQRYYQRATSHLRLAKARHWEAERRLRQLSSRSGKDRQRQRLVRERAVAAEEVEFATQHAREALTRLTSMLKQARSKYAASNGCAHRADLPK